MKFNVTEYPIAPSLFEYKNMENARQVSQVLVII
jgi:hypothetical protein